MLPLIKAAENTEDGNLARVTVAVLDTGIDLQHSSVKAYIHTNRIKGRKDLLTDGSDNVQDHCGHGTHVAASLLNLAPCADIYVARITKSLQLEKSEHIAQVIRPSPPLQLEA